ncbi:MAG TPA: cation:proton antiporter, partial [Rhizobiaceae bacterium]|nr:cation:proton antiporter [Rhizobiaceae bacterium]
GEMENVTALAEMGVLMLLFFIGCELSLRAFVVSLKQAAPVAFGQLVAAMGIAFAIAHVLDADAPAAITLGFIIAISSTVVAMKMLDDMEELRGEAGRIAVGILIAQDLAIVPMLIFISSFGGGSADPLEITLRIAVALAVLGALLFWLGRHKLIVPFTRQVEGNVELLALGSLGFCFGAAAVSGAVGLSPAYGAFVAGLIVGNSTLRSRVIPVIEPIQSVLLVAFFLSIGLLIDLRFIADNIGVVLGATVAVIVAKTALNIALLRFTGSRHPTALVAGLSMAQIGEFSFVLAAAGLAAGTIDGDISRLAIAVTAATLLFSPAWMALMHRVDEFAHEGYTTYREALAEAYHDHWENVLRGGEAVGGAWHWAHVRYRAGRMTLRRRKAKTAHRKAAREMVNGRKEANRE